MFWNEDGMSRRAVLEEIASLRQRRDRCDRTSAFERGMAAGFHLASHSLWRQWRIHR